MGVPDVKNYKLSEFFSSTYRVPKYQRNFSWGDYEVELFMTDILDFVKDDFDYYLLGEAIAANLEDASYDYELIDGQQRATTLMVLLAYIHRTLELQGATAKELKETTNALYDDEDGLRVLISGSGSETILRYLEGAEIAKLPQDTRSQKNIVSAFETIIRTFEETFQDLSKVKLLEIKKKIINKVYLGRLTLDSVEQATDFFERVNNRGARLTNADLLKNRLLQNLKSDSDYLWAADTWAAAEKNLMNKGKLGTIEFLLRQLRQTALRAKVQERELYDKTKELVSSDEGCIELVELIEVKHGALARLLDSKSPLGKDDDHASETDFFNFTQSLGVKLAASQLEQEQFEHLSKRLTARSILSLLASERSQAFEKLVPVWSNAVSKLRADATYDEIDEALSFEEKELQELYDVAKQRHSALRYDGTPGQVKRIRYILAKDNHIVNVLADEINFSMKDFLTTSRITKKTALPGFDIDHIFSRAGNMAGENQEKIGNLTLLHYKDNSAAGKGKPEKKTVVYGRSKALLTRALTSEIAEKDNVEKVISEYRVSTIDDVGVWEDRDFDARSQMYWSIIAHSLREDLGVDINLNLS